MSPLMVSATVLFLMGAVGTALFAAIYGSHRVMQERFDEMTLKLRTVKFIGDDDGNIPDKVGRSLLQWALQRVPAPKKTRATERLAQRLVQAGFRRSNSVRVFLLIRLIAIGSCAIVGMTATGIYFRTGSPVLIAAIIGAGIGFYAPAYYLRKKASKRQQNISRELSDVLDLLVVCVEAGLGLFEAIKVVGDETARQEQAIGSELVLVAGEVGAGSTLGEALRNLANRTAVDDLRPLAATLIQSEQLGAQVGPALRASSDSLRTKRRFRAEEAAAKSTVKILFPLVLFILPAMLLVIIGPAIIQAITTFSANSQ
jgi:tight adherence protein C